MNYSWPVRFLGKRLGFFAIYKHNRHALAILLGVLSLVMALSTTSEADTVTAYECVGTGCLPPLFTQGGPVLPPPALNGTSAGGTGPAAITPGTTLIDPNISFADPTTGFSFSGSATVNAFAAGLSGSSSLPSTTLEIELSGIASSSGATPGSLNIQVLQALDWSSKPFSTIFSNNQGFVPQSDSLTGSCNGAAAAESASVIGTAGMSGYPAGNLSWTCSSTGTFSVSNNSPYGGFGDGLNYLEASATFFFPADGSFPESITIPLSGDTTIQGVLTSQNPPSTVPEPSSMALLGVGLLGILGLWHRPAAS